MGRRNMRPNCAVRDSIDFDDLVIFGQRLVSEHNWVLPLASGEIPGPGGR